YIRIRPDGSITVFASQTEMGQGVHTGLATIVAEELDADFDSIQVVHAANGNTADGDLYGNSHGGHRSRLAQNGDAPEDVYGNPLSGNFQITGASSSTRVYW